MNKKDFDTIIYILDKHLEDCKNHLDNILTTEDLENLTIKQLVELREFCRKESNEMTEICMVDFYHIIGMGELTVVQQNTFLKKMKEYMTYRSDLKCISSSIMAIDSLPKLPSASSFSLKRFGGVHLTSKIRGRGEAAQIIEEECNIQDYHVAVAETKADGLEYNTIKVVGNEVTFKVEDLPFVLKYIQPGTCGKRDSLIQAARAGKDYCATTWTFTDVDETEIKGTINDPGRLNSFMDKLKAKIKESLLKGLEQSK